jgi:concanavalin A-like lectin/glucanase superfamily protein/PASTA domain-containing protein/Big-like domain-containing protein/purple acid phosphatase-like protein/lysyl oxidase
MRQHRWVTGVALITALGLLCSGRWRLDAAPAGTSHLPDLQVVVPLDTFSIEVTSPTTREFRYTHDQANLGDGPFELRLDYDPVSDSARAFQRIYTHDASTVWSILSEALVVGRFLYHPAHGHYHVPFASFGLFQIAADGSVGAPVAKSDKVGFCIADSVLIASIPHAGVFGYSGDHCADPTSTLGISVGWGDLYDFHDAGQAIVYEPATIPDGEYWFRAVADPFNYFIEKNEANNITDIRLRITGTAVTVVAGPFHPDSTPPAVSLTAPTAGAVSGTAVPISANASHASGISSVQFLLDGNPLGPPDSAPPYTVLWNTTTVPDGSHDVSAQALTPSGFYGTSIPVIVTVANNGPPPPPPDSPVTISNVFVANRTSSSATVTWTTNVLTTSEVSYGLDSNYGLFASDVSFGTNHSIPLTGLTPTTTYHYQVTSRDAVGNFATAGDFIFTTPAVSDITCHLTAPLGGTVVSGIINVEADAFGTASVRGVQFLLDGAPLGAEDTLEPWTVAWDTRSVLNGSHALSAVARDPTNNQAVCAPVPVIVSNSGPSTVGLVAAFGFDENGGAIAADSSGNANNGSISGATWTSDGRFGSALVFDGSDDIVTVNDANTLDLTNALTLEAWVYPTTLSGWRTALLKERPGGLAYALYAHDNVPRPAGYVNVGGVDQAAVGATALPLNAWSHLATTYDGAMLRLFVNAVQVGSAAVSGGAAVSANQLSIGGNTVWGEYFSGELDEIRIYNRALTQAEIQIDMNAPVTPAGTQVTVPSVVGLLQAAAETAIVNAGLVVGSISSQYSNTAPAGTVIAQSPTAGALVSAGTPVDLTISLGSAPNDWTFCASEGGFCAFTGTMEVRYGANGSYFFKTLSNGTACTNAVFGDPIFNAAKECAIRSTTPPPPDWTFCAAEGAFCAFTGTMEVRFGANGSYFYKTLSDGTACTNAVFGDPIVGTVKDCAIRSTIPTPDWTFCAAEGGFCAFTGTMEVRFGANGSYFYKTLSDGTACTNAVFGDPIVDVVKSCSIRAASQSPPTVTTTLPAPGASEALVNGTLRLRSRIPPSP